MKKMIWVFLICLISLVLLETTQASNKRRVANPPPLTLAPLPESTKWGFNDESDFDGKNQSWSTLQGYHDKGVGWVRYWVHWDKTAPHRPVDDNDYNWKIIDEGIMNMKRAGINVYLDIVWAPPWTTDDQPAYVTWMCMTWSPPYGFRPELPWCGQYKPDRNEWMHFVTTVVERYSNPPFNVKYFGIWNEPNYDIFWHYHDDSFSQTLDEGWPKSPNITIAKEILAPGYQAIKLGNPEAIVVGPEVDGPLFLKWVLQEEATPGVGPISDIVSFHIYGDGDDSQNIVDRLGPLDQSDGYGRIIRDFGRGRKVWITETWQGKSPDIYYKGIQDRPWIDKVLQYHGGSDWQVPQE